MREGVSERDEGPEDAPARRDNEPASRAKIFNERLKTIAGAANAIAVALVGAAFVFPVIRDQNPSALLEFGTWVWIAAGLGLHLLVLVLLEAVVDLAGVRDRTDRFAGKERGRRRCRSIGEAARRRSPRGVSLPIRSVRPQVARGDPPDRVAALERSWGYALRTAPGGRIAALHRRHLQSPQQPLGFLKREG